MSVPTDWEIQYQTFRDCVFEAITTKSTLETTKTTSKRRRYSRKASITNNTINIYSDPSLDDPSSLADFSDYLATEIFLSLPEPLRLLTYTSNPPREYTPPLTATTIEDISSYLSASVTDTLTTYSLITPPHTDLPSFLTPILHSYTAVQLTPPPPPSSTRPLSNTCELCSRTQLPLTYHHLIPKSAHAKALKRNWHKAEDLARVAWLCRACHSWVHRQRSNEELARGVYSMDLVRGNRRGGGVGWVGWGC